MFKNWLLKKLRPPVSDFKTVGSAFLNKLRVPTDDFRTVRRAVSSSSLLSKLKTSPVSYASKRIKPIEQSFKKGLDRGWLMTGSVLERVGSVGAKKVGWDEMSEKLNRLANQDKELARFGVNVVDKRKFREKVKDPLWIAEGLGQNIPNMFVGMGAALPTAVAGGGALAIGGTAFLATMTLEGGFAYEDALDFGVDKKKAEKVASMVGIINGFLETLPITKLLTRSSVGKKVKRSLIREITKRTIQQSGLEAGTESMQEIVSNAVATTYDKNRSLLEGVSEAAFFGGIMGGGMSLGMDVGGRIKPGFTIEDVSQSDKFLETMRRPKATDLAAEVKKFDSADDFIQSVRLKSIKQSAEERLTNLKLYDNPQQTKARALKEIAEVEKELAKLPDNKLADETVDILNEIDTTERGWFEKAKSFFDEVRRPITKPLSKIPKELEPLAKEARKYKSAEEFVKKGLGEVSDFKTGTGYFIKLKDGNFVRGFKTKELAQKELNRIGKDFYTKATKAVKEAKPFPVKKITPKKVREFVGDVPSKFYKKRETTLLKERIKKIQQSAISKADKKAKIQQLKNEFKIRLEKSIRKEQLKTLKVGITERIKGIAKGVRESRVLTKNEITDAQSEIIDILDKSALERSDKAKFIRAIKNVQTTEQLKKALPEIQERIETLEVKASKRTLKSKIKKELENTKIKKQAGKPVGKFTPEVQKNLNLFRDASKLSKTEAELKIQINLEKYKNSIPPEDVALENKILSMIAGMDEMSVSELQSALNQITAIKETGRLTVELKKFNRQTDIDMWVDKTIEIVTGGKGLPKNILTIGAKEVNPEVLKERVQKFMGGLGKEFVGWDDIIDMISRKTKPSETWLDDFTDVTGQKNAVKKGHRVNLGGDGKARKMAEEAFEIKKDRQMVKKFQEDANEISLGVFKNAQGEITDIIYTKAEARKAWMELQDPTLKETFKEGMDYTDEIIKAIDNFLTPQDKAFAKKQLNFYKEYYHGVNEIYRDIYGVDLPKNEFYSPIRREGIARDESVGFGEFLQEVSIRKSVTSGSLKSRVSNIKPLTKQSDIAVIEQHIAEMEHFKAWAHKIRDLKAVFGNPQVRTAIIREHGKGMLGMVDNFMGDFTRGGTELASRLSWLDKLRGNFSRAVLAIKPSIGIKQLTSFIAYADTIPAVEFGKGTIDFWKNPVDRIKVLRQSEMMKARSRHMDRDIKTAIRSDAYASFRKHPNFLNTLMLNIQVGDQGAIYAGGWSVYKYHRNQGKSHEEALRIFEKVTSTTQQSADLDNQSYWQRGGSFAKLFTMFKSAPNMFFRKMIGAIRNRIHGRITTAQLAKTIAIYQFIIPMFFQYVSDWFKWDPEEQKRAMILGPFNGIFIVGDGLDYLVRGAMGMRQFPSEIPLYSIANDLGKSVKLISDDDITTEDMFKAIRGLAGATGAVKGLPLKQPIDIGAGIKNVLDGEWEQGLAKILGWSPYIAEKEKKTPYDKAVSEDKEKDKEAREKIKPIYDEIQKLKNEGKKDEAKILGDKLSNEEYEIYKKIRTADKTKDTNKKKEEFYPTFLKIRKVGEKDKAEAMKIINGLTKEEYRIYELLKAQLD